MSNNPTNEQILEAIEQSGYLLEQHVATRLEALDFYVRTNVAFEDPDEGKSREIDVSAFKRVAHNETAKVSAFVDLIVECKNASNPLVFIARSKNEGDLGASPKQFRSWLRHRRPTRGCANSGARSASRARWPS
jgi:hypothetical protein